MSSIKGLGSSSSSSSSTSLGASTSASSQDAKDRKIASAQNSLKQANQAVDDATWRRDQAQKRLDQLKAEGKDAEKAKHSLDVANRELTDAKERQAQATNKLTDAQNATVEESAGAAEKTGGGFDDLGKSLWGGLLATIRARRVRVFEPVRVAEREVGDGRRQLAGRDAQGRRDDRRRQHRIRLTR